MNGVVERHAAVGALCVAAVLAAAVVATLLWAAETESGKGRHMTDTNGSATDAVVGESGPENVVDLNEVRRGAAERAKQAPDELSGAVNETTWSITVEGKGTEPLTRKELSRILSDAKHAKFQRDMITPTAKQVAVTAALLGFAAGMVAGLWAAAWVGALT